MSTREMNYTDNLDFYPIFKSWETIDNADKKISFSFLINDNEGYHINTLYDEHDEDVILIHITAADGVRKMVTIEHEYTKNENSKGVSVIIARDGEKILRSFSFNYTKVDTPIILNAFSIKYSHDEYKAFVGAAVWVSQAQRDMFNPVVAEILYPTLPDTDIIDIDFKDDILNEPPYVLLGVKTDNKEWITYLTTKPKVAVKKGNTQPGASKPYHTPWQ